MAEAGRLWEVGASMVCVIPATPASCTCCSHGSRARRSGGGQGAWIRVSWEHLTRVATLGRPARFPSLGLLVGPALRSGTILSMGIFPGSISRPAGVWEQLDSAFPVPGRPV